MLREKLQWVLSAPGMDPSQKIDHMGVESLSVLDIGTMAAIFVDMVLVVGNTLREFV